MCGMSRRRGYVLDCAVEGASSGSLLSVRMMRPNAYLRVSNHSRGVGRFAHLSNGVLGTADCQDAFHGTSGVVANSTFCT